MSHSISDANLDAQNQLPIPSDITYDSILLVTDFSHVQYSESFLIFNKVHLPINIICTFTIMNECFY